VIVPVAFKVRPGGSVPVPGETMLKVSGPVPVASTAWLYVWLVVPALSVVVVIFGAAGKLMVIDRGRSNNCPNVSVTLIVKLKVP
jgi:hypothetical protein